MKFNANLFRKNISFFIVTISIVVFFVVVSLFIDDKSDIEVSDLPEKYDNKLSKLVINEISSSNDGSIAAPDGGVYDFVEIYNGTGKDKDLTNYSLSDTTNEIKWAFPNKTIIKSGEYLVVYLAGINENGLYTNFKLKSAGGETLIFRSSSKKVVDAVDTISVSKGSVMARDKDGLWKVFDKASPGYNNDIDGYNKYIESITIKDEDGLVINEFLPRNDGNFKNELGMYSGYIELKNTGDKKIELKNYSISDELAKPFKFKLPEISLDSGEIFLIYTSGLKDNSKIYNATFKLQGVTGDAVLSKGNHIVESVSYQNMSDGIGYVKENDKFIKTSDITPGFENTNITDFQKELQETPETLIISEVMNNNYTYLQQNGGKFYDFIELYNNSSEEIKLSDYCISKSNNKCSDKLPDVTLKSKGYYVLMASGNSNLTNKEYHHLNFKIGDTTGLYLYKNDKIEHALFINNVPNSYSIGVNDNYGVRYYESPTPLERNKEGVSQIAVAPSFNIKSGVYNDVENLEVEIAGEGTVYYTTDGSTPSTSSNKYSGTIKLDKTTVINAISVNQNKKTSKVSTSSYIINENHEIEVLSVIVDPSKLANINGNAWVVDNEDSAYTEFFASDGTSFSIPCGLKLFGGSTRGHKRKSYSINFRKKYGEGTLEYPVFKSRDSSTYESLVLRTASQDETNSFFRDIIGTLAVDGVTELDVQAYRPVAMYINGKYWGFYFIREKVGEDFLSNHYNVDVTDKVNIIRIDWEIKAGNGSSYGNLLNYMKSNNMAEKDKYEYVKTKLNITSIIDFYGSELFITNNDIVNTRLFSSPLIDDGKWRYIFYDLDLAYYNIEKDYLSWMTDESGMGGRFNNVFIRNLMKNDEFKKDFLERMNYLLTKVWNKERTIAILDELLEKYTKEVERSHTRWGYSIERWNEGVTWVRDYLENRTPHMLSNIKSFFKLSDKQMKDYFGDLYE